MLDLSGSTRSGVAHLFLATFAEWDEEEDVVLERSLISRSTVVHRGSTDNAERRRPAPGGGCSAPRQSLHPSHTLSRVVAQFPRSFICIIAVR